MSQKFLTKSRFKIGASCPTKLYFHDRKEYGNNNDQNEFLRALADGGWQVGALAHAYFPTGQEITTKDHSEAVRQTNELLKQKNVVIFEAAFQYENLFIRADILEKNGEAIKLYEVKSGSFDSTEEFPVFRKTELKKKQYVLLNDYQEYLIDLAFQTYVVEKVLNKKIIPHLMMPDKRKFTWCENQ